MIDESDDKVLDFAGKLGVADLMKRAKARRHPEAASPGQAVPEAEPIDDAAPDDVPGPEEPTPNAGDPYKAHARQSTRAIPTLFVVRADGSTRGFPYGDLYGPDLLPGDDAGKGPAIVMRFARYERVTLAGRNLGTIHAYIGSHRMPWVRELPRGRMPAERDAPVITGVTIEEIDPR